MDGWMDGWSVGWMNPCIHEWVVGQVYKRDRVKYADGVIYVFCIIPNSVYKMLNREYVL